MLLSNYRKFVVYLAAYAVSRPVNRLSRSYPVLHCACSWSLDYCALPEGQPLFYIGFLHAIRLLFEWAIHIFPFVYSRYNMSDFVFLLYKTVYPPEKNMPTFMMSTRDKSWCNKYAEY